MSLAERTLIFSKSTLDLCKSEKITLLNKNIIDQLLRSATSIGANYAEANNAASRADFKNKIFIAKKEAAETKYWLDLLTEVTANKQSCAELKQECHYILMTLQKVINTLNNGSKVTDKAR